MKLIYSLYSPYNLKVRIAAEELGLELELELVAAETYLLPGSHLMSANPLAKIPTLIRDDGSALYDSAVIVEYLDSLAGGRLVPSAGEARWRSLGLQALATGLCDAGILRSHELRRPADDQRPELLDKQGNAVIRALDELEKLAAGFSTFQIGEIATAAALSYLEIRFGPDAWRPGRPALDQWFEGVFRRPSVQKMFGGASLFEIAESIAKT